MKLFFAYLSNHTDCRDDEVIKIKARDKKQAREIAEGVCRINFTIIDIYTRQQLKRNYPEWHSLLWGTLSVR